MLVTAACGGGPSSSPTDAAPENSDAASPDAAVDAAVPPGPARARYVYFSSGNGGSGIAIGAITDATRGDVRIVGRFDGLWGADNVLVDPRGRYLAGVSEGRVDIYGIDASSGWLTLLSETYGSNYPATLGESATLSADGSFLYLAQIDMTVRAYHVDPMTGTLTQVGGAAQLPTNASSILITPDNKVLYAVTSGGKLHGFTIAADGSIAPRASFPIDLQLGALGAPGYFRIDPTGRFLAYSLPLSDQVVVYAIDATSKLVTQVPGSPFTTVGMPLGGDFNNDGTQFYVPCEQADVIRGISIESTTGALTAALGSPYATDAEPEKLYFDREHDFAYVVRYGSLGATQMTVGTNGALTRIGRVRVPGGKIVSAAIASGAKALTFTPRFVYALDNANNGSITAYTIEAATGTLTAIANGSISIPQPYQAVAHPLGTHLYVISGSTGLHTYSIGSTGLLTELGTPIAIGSSPHALEISRNGQRLLVAVSGGSQLLNFLVGADGIPTTASQTLTTPLSTPMDVRWDGAGRKLWAATATGVVVYDTTYTSSVVLATSPQSLAAPTSSQPQLLASTPSGRVVYVALPGSDAIGRYLEGDNTADASDSGTLTPAGDGVTGIAVDPHGRFLFATDTGPYVGTSTAAIRAFRIVGDNGDLTAIDGAFASLPRPVMATVDDSGSLLVVAATGTVSPTTAGGVSVFPILANGVLGPAVNTVQGTYTSWVTVVSTRQ